MKSKKLIAMTLFASMLMSTIVGCGGTTDTSTGDSGSASTDTPTTDTAEPSTDGDGGLTDISFWGLSTRQTAIEAIVEGYKAETGVNVNVSYYDTDGIKDSCKVAASSGTLPTAWFNWGGALGSFYTENGLTYDLSTYADENGWDSKYDTSALGLCEFDGQLSGIPTSYNVLAVYYRKDIFEECGIDVPTTFAEFEAACATLKEAGYTPMSTGGLYGWHVMRWVEQLIEYYTGADKHDAMNSWQESYDNENVVEALEKYQEWVEAGYFPTGFITADPNDAMANLYSKSCAMDLEGQWADGGIIQNEQDISLYGAFAFPNSDDGKSRLSAFAEMTQINANASLVEVDTVVNFMDYYYNDANVAAYGEYMNQPLPLQGAAMPEGQPNVPDIIQMGADNGTFTITDQAFPTQVADVLFNQQDALANNQGTAKDAAAAIQAAIEAYVAAN